jgi:hypothetical protein
LKGFKSQKRKLAQLNEELNDTQPISSERELELLDIKSDNSDQENNFNPIFPNRDSSLYSDERVAFINRERVQ